MKIELDAKTSRVVVHGRATGHRFHTTFPGLSGTLDFPGENLNEARGELSLPMAKADAGDFLRTSQIKRFLDPKKHPFTKFELGTVSIAGGETLRDAMESGREVEVEVAGTLSYRVRQTILKAQARGTLSKSGRLRAQCKFKLDLRSLGIEPPSFLFLKVNPEVDIEVDLFGA